MTNFPDLNNLHDECKTCIKNYIKTFKLKKGSKFEIPCYGIKKKHIDDVILSTLDDPETAESIFNPVLWAKKNLDWICVDPQGTEWKRKTDNGTLVPGYPVWTPKEAARGKSPYNRIYQFLLLNCTSRRKVINCIDPSTLITLEDGSSIRIDELKIGDKVISIDENTFETKVSTVLDIPTTEKKPRFEITTVQGHKVIVSDDHPVLCKPGILNKFHSIESLPTKWLTLNTGLNTKTRIAIAEISIVRDRVKSENKITWDSVKRIKELSPGKMYDIVLDDVHTFIANSSMILHNCGRQLGKTDALCVAILYKIFTNREFSVTVITPYQSQIELIFNRLGELMSRNPELINSVKEKRKSPYFYMELHNGSYVKAFSAGTKSKAEAGTVRGTHAHFLVFDEADMLSRGDLDASLALITNFPEACVWMSSTPTGKRETFYNAFYDPGYKRFHYPSSVNPMFNDELEKFFRRSLTEDGYQKEILALFGEETAGVYQKQYIDTAKFEYEYGSMRPQNTWVYTFGVDWNNNAGTVIMIVGYNPGDGNYYVVDKQVIKKDGWTQTAAVQEIVRLNRSWAPEYIYVDQGFGHCVGPETIIQTVDGSKPIKNIFPGDKVLTCNGLYKTVLNKISAPKKETYVLKPSKCPKTIISYCHPFLTYRTTNRFLDTDIDENNLEWKTIKDIDIKKDFIAIAKTRKTNHIPNPVIDILTLINNNNLEWDNDYVWSKSSNRSQTPSILNTLAKKYGCSTSTLQRLKNKLLKGQAPSTELRRNLLKKIENDIGLETFLTTEYLKFNRYIDVTNPGLQLLLGWYLSEGNNNICTVELSQKKLLEDFDKVIQAAKELFPSVSVYDKSNGVCRLFIHGRIASELFMALGGKYCYNKRILPFIINNFDCKNIIQGIYLGDGHKKDDVLVLQLSLTSPSLIYQLRQYFIDRDILPSLYHVKKRELNRKNQFRIDLGGNQEVLDKIFEVTGFKFDNRNRINRKYYFTTPNYILISIDKIEQIEDHNDLIDLEIEDDHSFSGNGIILHNTQEELLHGIGLQAMKKQGHNSRDARLATIVKSYNFGGSVEVKDLFTKQPVKKPAKAFLVENSVRFFEDGKIKYPKSDNWLTKSLEGYYILRLTESGTPKYAFHDEVVGDHDVDALNLALVAFTLEKTEFGKPVFTTNISKAGYFGESKQEAHVREFQAKESEARQKEQQGERTKYISGSRPFSFGGIPVANSVINQENYPGRIWSWPGFLRDEPPPRKKTSRRTSSRPRRTNI